MPRRNAMEKTLSRNHPQLSSLLDNLPAAVSRIDRGLRCMYANRAFEALFGISRGERLEKTGTRTGRLSPESHGAWILECRSVLARGEASGLHLDCTGLDGPRRYSVHMVPEFDLRNEVSAVLSVASEDIGRPPRGHTHREAQKEAPQRPVREGGLRPQDRTASRDIDRHFLAYLSHELRTPLNAILGWTQVLQSGVIRRDTVLRALRQMEQSVRAQAQLLDELLNASESAGAAAFDRARPDLGTGLSQAGATGLPPGNGAAYRRLAGLRILTVDDDSNTRDMLQETLARAGARVHAAASARDALDLLQQYRPDVLVSDIGMPHEDGYALLQQLRALPPEEGGITPAIALTGYAREVDQIAARRAGYQAVVVKPVSLDDLMRTIVDVTARR